MKISIITINYNDAAGLERTIKSVHEQSAAPFEYLIIDGDSTDGSKEIIKKYSHHFSFTTSEPDHGIYDAMNKGIINATGDYLLFLNSGDTLFNSNVLEKVSPLLKSEHDLIYGDLYMVPTGQPSFTHTYPELLDFTFFKQTSLGHPATFLKKELFNAYGLYRTDLKIVSDWAFFLNVICIEKVTYKKIDLTISCFYEGGISTAGATAQLYKAEINKVLLENFALYDKTYDELIATSLDITETISDLNPKFDIVRTNKTFLKLANEFISLLGKLLILKRK